MTVVCPWGQARVHDESFTHFLSQGSSTVLELLPKRSRDLVRRMLTIEPEQRATMAEVTEILQNNFVRCWSDECEPFRLTDHGYGRLRELQFGYLNREMDLALP